MSGFGAKFLNVIGKTAKWILFASVVLYVVARIFVVILPTKSEIDRRLYSSPSQVQIRRPSFTRSFGGREYKITPRYRYRLYGLVVSTHDLRANWFNIDYWKDPLNVKDVCVIWGKNVRTNDYKKVGFSSGLWTCRYHYDKELKFNPAELSNNHILPADGKVMRVLREVRPGDQIELKGMLVDYESDKAGSRATSASRGDEGMKACEIVYAKKLRIIKDANPGWGLVLRISKYVVLGAAILWFIAFVFFPMPNKSPRVTGIWR